MKSPAHLALNLLVASSLLAPFTPALGQNTTAPSAPLVYPSNDTDKNGPAIPAAPAQESPHPAAVYLWPTGAPGSEARKDEKEIITWRREVDITFPVLSNVHNPSIVPYIPDKAKATGAAVIVAPGGGHMQHTIDREGYDLGKWLADHGIAAFVLKYRLANDISNPQGQRQPYRPVTDFGAKDAQRAARLIRSRAQEWGVDPQRLGILGFSAGAEIAADLAAADNNAAVADSTDPVEKQPANPNFVALVYGMPANWSNADFVPPANMPPTFLLCSSTDQVSNRVPALYTSLKKARVSVEMLIFSEGGHGFGVRQWDWSVAVWPTLFQSWLADKGFLKKSP